MNQKVAVGVVFVAAMFMSIMDATIVNVALPTIGRDLSPTSSRLPSPRQRAEARRRTRGHRFEQISGRSLASTVSLAGVWLAMRTTAAVPEG